MTGGERLASLVVTGTEVRRGDLIHVGGRRMTVQDVRAIGGCRDRVVVVFVTGEQLVMVPHTRLAALRTVRAAGPAR